MRSVVPDNSEEIAGLVSVIMPAYNCEKYVQKAIDSMLNQTYSNFELLICDDGSTDSTKNIIDSYLDGRIKLHHNHENKGYLKSSNKLIALSKGEFITFQDADDWSDLQRLETLVSEFRKNSSLMCAGSYVNKVDVNGRLLNQVSFSCTHSDIKNNLPEKIECVGSALMIRRKVYEDLGFYNEYFDRAGSEDLYWFGLVALNYYTINIPQSLYHYRTNPDSVSNDKNKSVKKQMSGDFAKLFLRYYIANGKEIFQSARDLMAAELYLLGKGYCWRNEYKKGLSLIFKSLVVKPVAGFSRIQLIRIYLPKLISARSLG